jgi:hypothetical protein
MFAWTPRWGQISSGVVEESWRPKSSPHRQVIRLVGPAAEQKSLESETLAAATPFHQSPQPFPVTNY